MCGDFKQSTQFKHWTFTKQQLLRSHSKVPIFRDLRIFLGHLITQLSSKLRLRQRVTASAQVLMSRLLVSLEVDDINLYLLVATCVYIASNAEEQPIHMRVVNSESVRLWPGVFPDSWRYIAECEFYVLEELKTCLVIYHPYSKLEALAKDLGMSSAELQAAWAVINDSYYCDVPLMYSPDLIACAACFMVLILKPELDPRRAPHLVKHRLDRITSFFGNSDVDLVGLAHVIQEIISLYTALESYDEKATRMYVDRMF